MNYQDLARQGRYGDTMLVHMAPSEVAGVASIFPGGVTQNPNTGLPEMFRLTDILGPVAGIAGSLLGGPLVGAVAGGLTTAATSGDLMKGILAGVGSYALGGFTEALGANAVGAAAPAQAAAAATAAPTMDMGFAQLPLPGQMASAAQAALPAASAGPQTLAGMGYKDAIANYASQDLGSRMGMLGQAASNPQAWLSAAKFAPMQAVGGVGSLMSAFQDPQQIQGQPQQKPSSGGGFSHTPPPGPGMTPPVGYVPDPFGRSYFAQGGIASLDGGSVQNPEVVRNLIAEARAALAGEHPRAREALARFQDTFGPQALAALQAQMNGGRTRGAGSGTDDLIPGSIEGRQEVRLADGEFVVPADVVSSLGDGSTDAGSRRLHEMMARVRKQRTGKEEMPDSVDDEALPA